MGDDSPDNRGGPRRWAQLRFAVVGPLLAAPPHKGELRSQLQALSHRQWKHPFTGERVRFGFSTIERWYYQARSDKVDPISVLDRRVRKDRGQCCLSEALRKVLLLQWQQHKGWSYQLHTDNLAACVKKDPKLLPMPSYSTVRRYMKDTGLLRRRRLGPRDRPGVLLAEARLEEREVRSFEAEYVHGLWHLDFHHASRQVITPGGQWQTPLLMAVCDDRSRLCCHAQWYFQETAQNLVHGLSQALQKRGLPRAQMTDNGAAMIAQETVQGLGRLGILHEPTLPASPYQNGKQEVFWAQVEGRLMAMLEGVRDLDLAQLNEATLAWVELEYNRKVHSETNEAPVKRFLDGPGVGRPCPSSEALRAAFTMAERRSQRRSDGTVSVGGVRYEVPSQYRHLPHLSVRYARWDLSLLLLCDPRTEAVLGRLYPVDKTKNAEGFRRRVSPPGAPPREAPKEPSGIAPLLLQLMDSYAQTGLPPAYVPKDELLHEDEEEPR